MSDLRRRDFITLLGGAGAGPLAARAQQGDPMRRLRVLQPAHRFDAFFQGLRDLGYANGQNIAIDYLSTEGHGEMCEKQH